MSQRERSHTFRSMKERIFLVLAISATCLAIACLLVMLSAIVYLGAPYLSWDFLTGYPSKNAADSGFKAALFGSIYVMLICAVVGIPTGIATAILLEEYQPRNPWLRRLHGLVQLNITNLAGVPSIVYGILGLTAFSQMFGLFGNPLRPDLVIGQSWYQRYTDLAGDSYYLPVAGPDAEKAPASKELALLTDTYSSAPRAEFRTLNSDDIVPLKKSVDEQIDNFRDAYSAGVAARRGPRGTGKAKIDRKAAENIVDAALAAATFEKDVAAQRDKMVEITGSMNGLSSGDIRTRRQRIYDIVDRTEKDALLSGIIIAGSKPTLVDRRAWYYFTLPFGRGVLAGALTLMLVILPIIIVSTQESLRAVPKSMRHGALALGATKWQSVGKIALPAAIPGACTGAILALSRAIGEAAPLLIIAGIVFITFTPGNLMDDFTVMPLQIYNWAGKPGGDFHRIAATGIMVLLVVLLCFNGIAIFIRNKFQRKSS